MRRLVFNLHISLCKFSALYVHATQIQTASDMHLRSCVDCRLLRAKAVLSSPAAVRKLRTTRAFASGSENAPAKQSIEPGAPQSHQSRISRQEATAWPALDFARLHSQVVQPDSQYQRQISPNTSTLDLTLLTFDLMSHLKHFDLQSPTARVRQHVNPFTPTLQVS